MPIFNIYKPLGKTPLQVLDQLREVKPEFKDEKMLYAGRLDPMAEGVMMVLVGEDRFKRDAYLGIEKEYEATFLFGFSTDTYDTLGIIQNSSIENVQSKLIKKAIKKLKGKQDIPFPAYSSFKVKGKPLVFWAREGRLDEIDIPLKTMEVFSVKKVGIENKSAQILLAEIKEKISLVDGDFRQAKVIEGWGEQLSEEKEYILASTTLRVASGTYIRSLANEIGKELGCGAVLYSLKRTEAGEHSIKKSAHIFK